MYAVRSALGAMIPELTGAFRLSALGIIMFGLGIQWAATVGRLLQSAGAAFALVG
jgi:hypothetical protein